MEHTDGGAAAAEREEEDAVVVELAKVKNWMQEGEDDRETATKVAEIISKDGGVNGTVKASADRDEGETKHVEAKTPPFPLREDLNRLVRVHRGKITKIKVDAVVNPTSSNLAALTDIIRCGGESLLSEARRKAAEEPDLTTGDSAMTRAYTESVPFNFVVHTVAPRWRKDFAEAAEHALFCCYRGCLVKAMQKRGVRTIAIPVLSHYFPPKQAASIAARALRRFFERFVPLIDSAKADHNSRNGSRRTSPLDAVIFVVARGKSHHDAFAVELRRALRLFFPRTKAEESMQTMNESFLKRERSDYDETGARVIRDRGIRITGTFAPLNSGGSASTRKAAKAAMLRRKQERDARRRKERSVGGDGDDDDDDGVDSATGLDSSVARAFKTDIVPLNWLYPSGTDSRRRPIIVVNGAHLPVAPIRNGGIDMERAIAYAIRTVKSVASRPYVVVYTHSGFDSERNMPPWDWLNRLHLNLPREHRKLLQKIYVLHGDVWLKMRFWFQSSMYLSVSSKLWKKIEFVDSVPALRSAFDLDQLILPSGVYRFDRATNPQLYRQRASSN